MAGYVDILGHPTWTDVRGDGAETVLLLHGGLDHCDSLLDSIGPALVDAGYRVVAFDRRGHGRTADIDAPFSYESMTDETVAVIEHVARRPVHVVGWSDGGIIGLVLARRRPDLVAGMVLIGANFHFAGIVSYDLPPDSPAIRQIADDYAARSPDGADHLPVVMGKTFTLFDTQPTMSVEDVATITAPTLVLVGDDDMISLAHTCALYEALPHGQLAVVPAASHAVAMEKPDLTARLILDFLAAPGPPTTAMPIRRAARPSGSPTPAVREIRPP